MDDVPRHAPASRARTMIMIVGLCAATIAGCSSAAPHDAAMPSNAAPSPELTTTLPPPPLSATAYQEALRSADSALASAFAHLSTAGSLNDAQAALDQVSSAASDAARALDVVPPVQAQATHRDLITGLQQLATDLATLRDQVASMELCAMPSVLPSVSNTTGLNSLRTVRDDLNSGRLGASYQWGEFLPAATPLPDRQLSNGQLVDNVRRNGHGQFNIANGDSRDAVVKLVQAGQPIVSVYVSRNSSATVEQISDGSYAIFFTSGADWDDQLKTFTRSCHFERFEQTVDFTTTPISNGIRAKVESITLTPVINGNAQTDPVPAQSFPR